MSKLLLLISLVFTAIAFGQNEKVDLKKLDTDLLNKYVLAEVNTLRKRKRVDILENDIILEKAAKDQADYMAENNEIGHDQKAKNKRTPYDRVVYYEGSHNGVGENVQSFAIDVLVKKSKGRLTYGKLAKEIVTVWVKSKAHYTNLIAPNYANIGHAFTYKDGLLYAAEVFGTKPFEQKYAFQKGPEIFVKEKKECLNCKRTTKKMYNDEVSLGWYEVSNDSVFYWNVNQYNKGRFYRKKKGKYLLNFKKNNIAKVFGAGGIITMDLIHHEQFDCNGKGSFHNSLYYNGYYIGAVDKSVVKYNDLNPSENYVEIFVGMKPAFADTFYQVDFNLIKRNKLCIQTSTIYVTPDYLKPKEFFKLPTLTIGLDNNIIIEDSVIVRIPFERNQTDGDTTIFQPLVRTLDSLVVDEHNIELIYYTGVASIEGSEKENRKLFIRRGAIIEEYIKRYYPAIPFQSSFYENFDDFRAGLVSIGYADVNDISDDTLRIFANNNKNEEDVAEVLDQTRFSTIKVVYRDYLPIKEGFYGLSVERLQDLVDEKNIKELIPLYITMINKALDGDTALTQELAAFNFPDKEEFAKLHRYKFIFELNQPGNVVDAERINQLKNVGAITSDAQFLEYALLFNLFNQNQEIDISESKAIIEGIKQKRQKAWVESLALILDVETNKKEPDFALGILMDNVLKRNFELRQTYFICQYLIQWGYTAEPYVLLSKYARRPGEIHKLYGQYIKLGYYLQQFENEREWKKIRNVISNMAKENPKEFCELFKWEEMGVRCLEKPEIAKLFCETCRDNLQE